MEVLMATARKRRIDRTHGFTLLEVVVVLMIIGMLASAVGLTVINHMRKSRIDSTRVRARTIQTAAKAFLLNESTCPNVQDLLDSGEIDPTTDHKDAWGSDFTIECDDITTYVTSPGPDKALGNEDDVGF